MKPSSDARVSVMIKSFVVNITLIVIKVVGGILVSSAALIADAVHSTSDFFSDVLVLFGLKHTQKPADPEHPMGHGKLEYVLSLFLGLGVLFIAYQLIRNIVINLNGAPEIPNMMGTVIVLFVIASKLVLARYLTERGTTLESQVVLASGKESFTDVLGSLVVLLGFLLSYLGDTLGITALLYADRAAAFLIALLIIRVGIRVIAESITFVIGKSASETKIDALKETAYSVNGVKAIDHLTAITYGHYYQVAIDIVVDGTLSVENGHEIAHEVRDELKRNHNIREVIVHVNPEVKP
ncbi:MAG: cation diffusion facilitator family transporter [Bacillota bacterium]